MIDKEKKYSSSEHFNISKEKEHSESYKFILNGKEKREDIFYCLSMIPYPSGAGMHLGHVLNYTAIDVYARLKRLKGLKVLNPICWDAFGLPTENYAMKIGQSASQTTTENIRNFKQQAEEMNWGYDWDREFSTSSPEYYKWTQRLFTELFKVGLVYKKETYQNRCSSCQTVLANDQVIEGKCERCDTEIIKKPVPQRFIKITDYADRLIEDLEEVDRPEETKRAQINWIGRREGMNIKFGIGNKTLEVFSEHPEYLYGVNAIRICPEHPLLDTLISDNMKDDFNIFKQNIAKKTTAERSASAFQDIQGNDFQLGAINPINGQEIPIILDASILPDSSVLSELVIPCFNDKDKKFSEKYHLKRNNVIEGDKITNSGTFSGRIVDVRKNIEEFLISTHIGEITKNYNLRDRSVSRQRYWGSPIPICYDQIGNAQLIDKKELPVELPLDVTNYRPTGTSPLAQHPEFSTYKEGLTREYDTLDTFVDSAFYYLRFLDPHNQDELLSKEIAKIVSDVDLYMGGREHTVGHLLYARFIHKFLYDQGYIPTKEPFKKLVHQGMILAEDGRKMSKRWGNVVNPMDIIKEYSNDVLKLYILFIGPLEEAKLWNNAGIKGIVKFLNKIETLSSYIQPDIDPAIEKQHRKIINTLIEEVTENVESFKYNVAISKLMISVNSILKDKIVSKEIFNTFLIILFIFAPDTAERLRKQVGNMIDIHEEKRPTVQQDSIEKSKITLPIQINGKVKSTISIEQDISQEKVLSILQEQGIYAKLVGLNDIKKIIFIPNKIINFVI